MPAAEQLKLVALDEDDLAIISAHVQDAVTKVAGLVYRPKEQRFALELKRFVWETALEGNRTKTFERRQAVLHFDRVRAVKITGIDQDNPESVLELLAVVFGPKEEPGGLLTLHFAGGAAIRLDVEVIEAYLTDLGTAWATRRLPQHDLSEPGSAEATPAPRR